MSFYYQTPATGTDVDITVQHYVRIKQWEENLYWDTDDDTFKPFADLVDGKIYLDEIPHEPGIWTQTIDLGTHTGNIVVIPRKDNNDVISGKVREYYLIDGDEAVDIDRKKRPLHENYGGNGNLRYLDDDGNPIEGATIRVYTKQQFDDNEFENPIGATYTDRNGEWVNPVHVNTQNDYVVHFHKPGDYGPDNIELTVT